MNKPKPGECWEIHWWTGLGPYEQIVLVITEEKELGKQKETLFECLEGANLRSLPIWMFNNAILINRANIKIK